jgi:hypothetical protein
MRRSSFWVEDKKKTYRKSIIGWRKLARGERKYIIGVVLDMLCFLWAGWILNVPDHFQANWNQVIIPEKSERKLK